jgi:hypothetical protein
MHIVDELDPLKPLPKVEGLSLDIDIRLRKLWVEVEQVEQWDITQAAAFIRAAYGQGYMDALKEDAEGSRAKLCHDHGYRAI